MDARQIETLDEVSAQAVPASEAHEIAGWVARWSPGLAAKRANSVWPRAHSDERALDAKLATVEAFYADRGLPARYQISPASQPRRLERALRRRGYTPSAPTAVARCALTCIADQSMVVGSTVRIDPRASGDWWATWQAASGIDATRLPAVAALFDRISAQKAFVTVTIESGHAAVAMGVLDGCWIGIFNMATLPVQRRRGAGRTALLALADWARSRGATSVYLQVELDNRPALDLYHQVGFRHAYRYHYLTQA